MKENHSRKYTSTTSRIHKIYTFIFKMAILAIMFLIGIRECVHVSSLGLTIPSTLCWNVGSVHFKHTHLKVSQCRLLDSCVP